MVTTHRNQKNHFKGIEKSTYLLNETEIKVTRLTNCNKNMIPSNEIKKYVLHPYLSPSAIAQVNL